VGLRALRRAPFCFVPASPGGVCETVPRYRQGEQGAAYLIRWQAADAARMHLRPGRHGFFEEEPACSINGSMLPSVGGNREQLVDEPLLCLSGARGLLLYLLVSTISPSIDLTSAFYHPSEFSGFETTFAAACAISAIVSSRTR
jgi:hypothetical protein